MKKITIEKQIKRRENQRFKDSSNGTIILTNKVMPCVIINISRTGAMIKFIRNIKVGMSFDIAIENIGIMHATVKWGNNSGFGISFMPPKLENDDYSNKMGNYLKILPPLDNKKNINGFW